VVKTVDLFFPLEIVPIPALWLRKSIYLVYITYRDLYIPVLNLIISGSLASEFKYPRNLEIIQKESITKIRLPLYFIDQQLFRIFFYLFHQVQKLRTSKNLLGTQRRKTYSFIVNHFSYNYCSTLQVIFSISILNFCCDLHTSIYAYIHFLILEFHNWYACQEFLLHLIKRQSY
jgi:hypothetical protein